MNIEKEIKENQALLFLTSKSIYYAKLAEIVKALDKNFKKICYVNLNKSYENVKKKFNKNKIDPNKFFVIGLNKYAKEDKENYGYIASPTDFGGINLAFSYFVYRGYKSFLFDSLNTMIENVKENEFLKFIHTIIVKAKIANVQVVFLALNENIDPNIFSELNMLFGNIINEVSNKVV